MIVHYRFSMADEINNRDVEKNDNNIIPTQNITTAETIETDDNNVVCASSDGVEIENDSTQNHSPTTSVSKISIQLVSPVSCKDTPLPPVTDRKSSSAHTSSPPPQPTSISEVPASIPTHEESQPPLPKVARRSSEVANRSVCPVCQGEAVKKKNVLKCSLCTKFVHFACTNLPPYMLYSLSTTAKKFTCEECVATPEHFLTDIVTNICRVSDGDRPIQQSPAPPAVDNRYDILESKVNALSVVLEKFDMQSLTDNLTQLGGKLECTNNNMAANVKAIDKVKKEMQQCETGRTCEVDSEHCTSKESILNLRKDLEMTQKELCASRSSNELLMTTITERDNTLSTLRERFEKTVAKHADKDKRIMHLEKESMELRMENTSIHNEKVDVIEKWNMKNETLLSEKEQFSQSLEEASRKLNDLKATNSTHVEVNALLKTQMTEVTQLNKSLQESINRLSKQQNMRPAQVSNHETHTDEDDDGDDGREEIVILHDSLCKKVNDTILSRENVKVKKIWAPDIDRMEAALDDVSAKVIVLEAWTRDLDRLDVEDMTQKIIELVSKALSKAEKVVISSIVNREDIDDIDLKVNSVNAFILLKYKRNESVIVCDNSVLNHRDFREADRLHLNEDGVPVFASNLKHAMAKAVGVRVAKKEGRNSYSRQQKYDRENRRFGRYNDNRGPRW